MKLNHHARRELKKQFRLIPGYLVMFLWLGFTVALIGWIIIASLSTTGEIFSNKLLQSGLHFENYLLVLKKYKMGTYFLNSLLYAIAGCAGTVLIGAPAAYVLSRFRFRGKNLINNIFVLCLSIPTVMLILPLFKMAAQFHLAGSRWLLIILYICINVPFSVFFLAGFFGSLPKALEEAAEIDGCKPAQAFWKIMFPLAQPGIVTLCIFNFINIWNEYFMALIFATEKSMRTVSTGLQAIVQSMTYSGNWAGLFAGVVTVFLPTFILYIFLLLYICPMFVAASHRRGTSHCLSCIMEAQWSDVKLQELCARWKVSQPAFHCTTVRFVQVEQPQGSLVSANR